MSKILVRLLQHSAVRTLQNKSNVLAENLVTNFQFVVF